MIKKLSLTTLLLLASCSPQLETAANNQATESLDQELTQIIQSNNLTLPITASTSINPELVALGQKLFSDNQLSGDKNISCQTCHHSDFGTSDGLPFSIGTGATNVGTDRFQINGTSDATKRNAPSLFNLGLAGQTHAFHDGRVSLIDGQIQSPDEDLTAADAVKDELNHVFAIQPLFPVLSEVEMLGSNNELSDLNSNLEIWQNIVQNRLITDPDYQELFAQAFPNVNLSNINHGHIGRAIQEFMSDQFMVNDTPFDRYLNGDSSAMTSSQKRGMVVFFGRGHCHECHNGRQLTNLSFESVGVPQISLFEVQDDIGQEETTGDNDDRYHFKTPALRNVSLTAPFMHNGAFDSLEAVVEHYDNIATSLQNYQIPSSYQQNYDQEIVLDTNSQRNQDRFNQVSDRRLRQGLRLRTQEKSDLVEFLKNGLTDESFKQE